MCTAATEANINTHIMWQEKLLITELANNQT